MPDPDARGGKPIPYAKRLATYRQGRINGAMATVGGPKSATVQYAKQAGVPINSANLRALARGLNVGNSPGGYPTNTAPKKTGTGSSGGGRGGGGGGGGGAGAPQYNQGQVDWLTQLLAKSRPNAQAVGPALNLPDTKFDPSMYNDLEKRFGQGVAQSRTAANTAYNNLQNYLTSNYKNAFAGGPPPATQVGMDQAAMGRMLQGQGVDPSLAAGNANAAAAANAGFGNIWGLLGANENSAQQNRLNRVQTDRGTTGMAIDAANLQGMTGIGLQRGQAQSEWQQRQDQAAQQEAMANWQRGNTVSDSNMNTQNSYTNALMQALIGFMPELKGTKLNMPNLGNLGLPR